MGGSGGPDRSRSAPSLAPTATSPIQDEEMHRPMIARRREVRRAARGFPLVAATLLALAVMPAAAQDGASARPGPANRLARETSPYLLLHAHNPVDWYPWGP